MSALSFSAAAGPVFDAPTLNPSQTFQDALGGVALSLAYDGANYWSAGGVTSSGPHLANYSASGALNAIYWVNHDLRSVFTSAGSVFVRDYNSPTIYKQTAPGVFTALVDLSGGTLHSQSSVVIDRDSNYIAFSAGQVSQWDNGGNYLGSVTLNGFGSLPGEALYPQSRGIAVAGDYWLTYYDGTLSAWNHSGQRVDQTTLLGAGDSFFSNFSLSVANGKVFVTDGETWRGYAVSAVPEPTSHAMLLGGLALLGVLARRRQA